MRLSKKNCVETLSKNFDDFFVIKEFKEIEDFVITDINLSADVSAAKEHVDLINYPYLKQPLLNCVLEDGKRKQICLCLPQQMGKSMIGYCSLIYNAVYNQVQILAIYPSVELAEQMNATKFLPMFSSIKQFEADLKKPWSTRSDRIKLSNAVIHFMGAGSKIVARSAQIVFCDQVAIWQSPPSVDNIAQAKKRTRSFDQCLQIFVSSPRYKSDGFWREFLGGSQAFFYLRCQGCGQLTLRSADLFNLQFQSEYNEDLKLYTVIHGSERLVCPKCKYEHTEDQRPSLIKQGDYIHTFPQRKQLYPTYQAGVLASLLNTHSWGVLADYCLSSGRDSSIEEQMNFDNSIRGLPWTQRQGNRQDETAIEKHFFKANDLKKEDIECIILVADTQDTFSVVGTFAITKQSNFYCLSLDRPRFLFLDEDEKRVIDMENKQLNKPPQETVLDMLNTPFLGIMPLLLMMDCKGHRTEEVRQFAKIQKNICLYQGTNLRFDIWKFSQSQERTVNADARKLQAELIFYLYNQKNKENNYLFLTENLTEKDINEIICVQPDNSKRNGNIFENWQPKSHAVHDFFDVLKMFFCAVKILPFIFRKEKFIHGQAKCLYPNKKLTMKQK